MSFSCISPRIIGASLKQGFDDLFFSQGSFGSPIPTRFLRCQDSKRVTILLMATRNPIKTHQLSFSSLSPLFIRKGFYTHTSKRCLFVFFLPGGSESDMIFGSGLTHPNPDSDSTCSDSFEWKGLVG